ncbi:MAG: hypothetical protein ABSE28_18850 [Candidatus Sulfotelmatobacter sp.]|jgi:hypothetical protein
MEVEIKIAKMSERGTKSLLRRLIKPAREKHVAATLIKLHEDFAPEIAIGIGNPVTNRMKVMSHEAEGEGDWASRHGWEYNNIMITTKEEENKAGGRGNRGSTNYATRTIDWNEAWLDQKYWLRPDYETFLHRIALKRTDRAFSAWLQKQTQKLWGVIGSRGVQITGTMDSETCWEAYLTFKLSDGAQFDLKCKITYHHDGGMYQSPTTFHNVITAAGEKIFPSEKQVKDHLAPSATPSPEAKPEPEENMKLTKTHALRPGENRTYCYWALRDAGLDPLAGSRPFYPPTGEKPTCKICLKGVERDAAKAVTAPKPPKSITSQADPALALKRHNAAVKAHETRRRLAAIKG